MKSAIPFILCALCSILVHVNSSSVKLAEAQIEWLRSKGGYYSDKIQIKPLFESESESVPLGLFATDNFNEGETVIIVPRHCLLTAGPSSEDMCDTTINLIREYRRGHRSEFAPYVTYLFSKDSVPLPSTWSKRGKKLIRTIRGKKLPPRDLTSLSFEKDCGGSGSALEEFAYMTVVSRAWTDKLVPVFDMVNHHSGKWANIDSTKVHGTKDDVVIRATRRIAAGEQLHLSYMDCVDEAGYELEYVLPHMLRDFGFVDKYPQRWIFPANPDLVFDLDIKSDDASQSCGSDSTGSSPEMTVTWHTDEPNDKQKVFLREELMRLEELRTFVMEASRKLQSNLERDISLEYYQSLTLALRYALGIDTTEGSCATLKNDYTEDDAASALENEKRKSQDEDWMACRDYVSIPDDYESIADFYTHYQPVDIYYDKAKDDSCLYLDGYLHCCASSRPQYHEVFVHYPARFIHNLKRVLFIGGGDSMVLHEVLKYPSLELVVGLELDQQVVRASFKHFGTQPHFHNEKVQWWFGDAAKSLLVLPKEYYHSFDLVVVDILTEVAQMLKVNQELNILDAAMLLLGPGGIIIKNEDEGYVPGSTRNYTKYSVDLIYHDVPLYCLQTFVVGSNTVDFLTAKPKDHNVELVYLKGVEDFQSHFDSWYNYGGDTSRTILSCEQRDQHMVPDEKTRSFGVLMILEAENTTVALSSPTMLQEKIVASLEESVGLSKINAESVTGKEGFILTFILKEGYVVARCLPRLDYCAFDVQLWAGIEKLDLITAFLLRAVGSDKPSSYRMVTGGMFGYHKDLEKKIGPPSVKDLCLGDDFHAKNTPVKVHKERKVEEFGPPQAASLATYNNTFPLEQWMSQAPHGTQSILQFALPPFLASERVYIQYKDLWYPGSVIKLEGKNRFEVIFDDDNSTMLVKKKRIKKQENGNDNKMIRDYLVRVLKALLQQMSGKEESQPEFQVYDNVGDGVVMTSLRSGGNVVAVWDGRSQVDFNLFLFTDDKNATELFEILLEQDEHLAHWPLSGRDEFPRGIGHVINFRQDLGSRGEPPVWALRSLKRAANGRYDS